MFGRCHSCISSEDKIVVHDGSHTKAPVIAEYCDTQSLMEIYSSGPNLVVEFFFRSSKAGVGFEADYEFIHTSRNAEIPSTGEYFDFL